MRASTRAADEGVDPGGQLRRGEGLGDIVVRAGHQAGHLVDLLALGGEHDDAHLGAGGADAPTDLKAVDIRQHDVQQGKTDIRVCLDLLQCLRTGSGLNRLVPAAAEIDHDEAAEIAFIFHDQYFFHLFGSLLYIKRDIVTI